MGKMRSRDEVLDDYVACRARGMTVREAAEAMGMTYKALDKALYRASKDGDPRAEIRFAIGRWGEERYYSSRARRTSSKKVL